jgi:hypothetical protein
MILTLLIGNNAFDLRFDSQWTCRLSAIDNRLPAPGGLYPVKQYFQHGCSPAIGRP